MKTALQLFDDVFHHLGIESEQYSYLGKLYELADYYEVPRGNRTEAQIMKAISDKTGVVPDNWLLMDFLRSLFYSFYDPMVLGVGILGQSYLENGGDF